MLAPLSASRACAKAPSGRSSFALHKVPLIRAADLRSAMRLTTTSILSLSLAYSSLAAVVPRWHYALSCSDLWEAAPKMLPDLEVYIAENVPGKSRLKLPLAKALPDAVISAAGYTLPANSTWSTPAYPAAVPDLPAFCRFGGYIHTSNTSKVQFEVWLPDEWSGRFSMVGNGGDAGGVNFPDMWAPIKKYNMAVASTDTGRESTLRLLLGSLVC